MHRGTGFVSAQGGASLSLARLCSVFVYYDTVYYRKDNEQSERCQKNTRNRKKKKAATENKGGEL